MWTTTSSFEQHRCVSFATLRDNRLDGVGRVRRRSPVSPQGDAGRGGPGWFGTSSLLWKLGAAFMTGGLLTGKGVGHLMRKTRINKFAKEYQTWSAGPLLGFTPLGFKRMETKVSV